MSDNEFFKRIESIDWFNRCEKNTIIKIPYKIKYVDSYEEAIEYNSSQQYDDIILDFRNDITGFLHLKYPKRDLLWNKLALEGRSFINEKVIPKIEYIAAGKDENYLVFKDIIMWNVLAAIMEEYYKDCKGLPIFFKYLLEVYEMGHIPCGWIGDKESGTLVVY